MKANNRKKNTSLKSVSIAALGAILTLSIASLPQEVSAKIKITDQVEVTKRTTAAKIRTLLEPLLDKYCHEECKLMAVTVEADLSVPDEVAPGFDDVDPRSREEIEPTAGTIRLLIDEKVGEVSKGKLLDLIQQYLDNLDFPVRIETQTGHFPQPVATAGKVVELRERVSKQFKATIEDLFRQFCPEQCLLADYSIKTDVVNTEEAQYGTSGEFFENNGVAIRVRDISGTILVDESLPFDVRNNILEMSKLKTNYLKNVTLSAKSMKFPKPASSYAEGGPGGTNRKLASTEKSSTDSKNTASNTMTTASNETNAKQERFERFERIERVENGDAVQAELQKFKIYGLIFGCSILSLLVFLAMASYRPTKLSTGPSSVHKVIQQLASDPVSTSAPSTFKGESTNGIDERASDLAKRYEAERLHEELMSIFAQQPKVAKHVFTRILTEEGVETTAQYVHLFGENVVMDMLRDPSLQTDLNELIEYYAKNIIELEKDEKLDLLRKLSHRTVAGKLAVMGSRSSHLFDYLAEMDGTQIMELIRNESLTVKSIVLTQCDSQKRAAIYAQMDEESRMKLLAELSRIDYLPRDYIFNVANALKRKRRENPKLNTEALPGSEVLLTLLERSGTGTARTVIKALEMNNPDSARTLKSKLVTLDTLRHLRDGQLLEVVLSLRHDELLQFLKGAPAEVRSAIFSKSPKDLVTELEEELANVSVLSRESYQAVERKILNRMKLMSNEGLINLVETNDRMLSEPSMGAAFVEAGPADQTKTGTGTNNFKKVAGW